MKKILAVAIASAFAAPAFAATSNVDVYGSINVSLDRVDTGAAGSSSFNRMVTNNNSFIGFKGSEDLGGGLKAVWQIESNISIDGSGTNGSVTYNGTATGTATAAISNSGNDNNIFGTRNTFLGLAGGFGTVLAGVHDTPYKMSTGPLDLFVGTLGDYNGVFGSAGSTANSSLFDLRTGNTIAYVSPKFSGFDVKAAYVMGLEGAETTGQNRSNAYSLSGTYANGPLFATAAYEKHNDVGTTTCNSGAVCLGEGTTDRDAWKVGVGYKFGDLKLGAVYEDMDNTTSSLEHKSWMLNAGYAIGAITLKASYTDAGDVGNVANTGARMYAVGADYALSKRTVVQATYARINNETGGAWGLGQGPRVAATAGDDPNGFSLGMKHTF
jgi:predicted porin